jgi:hypothetical protein
MAITPVKTGNVTTPPPAKKIDAKLTTQFNAAAKAGETAPPKPVVPFYTPQEGSFKEKRSIGIVKYNVRLNWQINEDQQKDSDKVFIRGNVTIDDGKKNLQTWAIDGKNSYITNDGSVYYKADYISKSPYKATSNIFKNIDNQFFKALNAVKANKTYYKDADKKNTPISLASSQLTAALNLVGEQNIRNGVGLNGVGKKVKDAINEQLSKTDTAESKVLVRKAVALAVTAAGVKVKYNQSAIPTQLTPEAGGSKQPSVSTPQQIKETAITEKVGATIQRLRHYDDNGNKRKTPLNNAELTKATIDHFRSTRNLREVAMAYVNEFAKPGFLLANGINDEGRRGLLGPIMEFLGYNFEHNRQAPLEPLAYQFMATNIPVNLRTPLIDLLRASPIYNRANLNNHINAIRLIQDNNTLLFEDTAEEFMGRALDRLYGIGTSQTQIFKKKDEL